MENIKSETLRSIINVTTVLFYILFSVIKKILESASLMWIPAVLFFANALLIGEMIYTSIKSKNSIEKKEWVWIIIQLIVNLGLAILSTSYLF